LAAKVIWWCGLNRKAAPSRRAPQVVRRLRRHRLKFVREQFFLAAAAQNIKRLVRFLTIGTEEKYFLKWKKDEQDNSRFKLDKYLLNICEKHRLIELMHDFVLFAGGVKKLPRVHQYFGVKKTQEHVRQNKGGIVWHTQGSGKSIVMVLLAWGTIRIPASLSSPIATN